MRLHRLEITAFGPFADTATVDFDTLSDAGLFLLSGATGAGKTSVLDAVAFALYGDVPGDRSRARRFRSDAAAPGVAPRVLLEVTLAGRRFRCTRSPQWQRPKRRGTGMTTQQASVLVEERVDAEWQPLSSRLDEAGHLVTGLVGMDLGQFCCVAMLPQGRFQAFLRARSEERHQLLQQLFSTQRFEDVETWLREHARTLRREGEEHRRRVAAVTSRLLEAGAGTLPEDWSTDDLTRPAGDGELGRWAAEVLAAARREDESAAAALVDAAAADAAAQAAHEDGRRLAEDQSRHAAAERELAGLAAEAAAHERRRDRLARGRRAATVLPLHRVVERAAQEVAGCEREGARTLAAAPVTGGDDRDLAAAEQEARDSEATARQLLPRERELAGVRRAVTACDHELAGLVERERALDDRVSSLPARVAELTTAGEQAEAARIRCEQLALERGRLDDRLTAYAAHTARSAELADAEAERAQAVERCLRLRETWLDLREARIRGMAAELAHGLAVGDACPVCGSAEHPHRALAGPGAATAREEKHARAALDDAEVDRTAREARVHELGTTLAVLARDAGDEPEPRLVARREAVSTELGSLRPVADAAPRLGREADAAAAGLAAAADELAEVRTERATRHERRKALVADERRTAAELDAALTGSDGTLADVAADAQARALACRAALDARAALRGARDRLAEARAVLDDWLTQHDFPDARSALDAVLDDEEADRLEAETTEHRHREARARSVVEDPRLRAGAGLPAPGLESLAATCTDARERHAAARAGTDVAHRRAGRLEELVAELDAALAGWEPVRAAHALAAELAALTEGTSADNTWRMRLSAYVLAWRLGQVTAAANERLLRMSDRRYTLEHSGTRGAGERRGGLSLLIRDEWSGEARDPATLSGGETFVVSLALALGLADVVSHEAGGTELDTLFVDEGFGTLDPDTLDDVMDVLDSLRDGGRVVGVVSHVTELRTRIPVQLVVTKDRAGSGVAVRHAVG